VPSLDGVDRAGVYVQVIVGHLPVPAARAGDTLIVSDTHPYVAVWGACRQLAPRLHPATLSVLLDQAGVAAH
jgi:hypothetical protein